MSESLYFKVRKREHLWPAWRHVRQKGLQSSSVEIREAVEAYDREAARRIERTQSKLREHRYQFKPAKGLLKERSGKQPRPIVISHLDDRVVQRSLLSVLQDHPHVRDFVRVSTSFGGIEERGVREALATTLKLIEGGANHFARSDIKDFFQCIPKDTVLELIEARIQDRDFVDFLAQAINVELENLGPLGRKAEFFPLYEIGVAQGCCLSPLLGNILLHDFDTQLNDRGLHCLRYIDDFLLLGPSERSIRKGFESALALLENLGLTAYNPWAGDDKAEKGLSTNGIAFLGCEVKPNHVLPDHKARKRLLDKVRDELNRSARALRSRKKRALQGKNLVSTLRNVHNIVKGWGNQYSFCNVPRLWGQLDGEIDLLIKRYLGQYKAARRAITDDEDGRRVSRRLLGVHLLEDSNVEPIVANTPPKEKAKASTPPHAKARQD